MACTPPLQLRAGDLSTPPTPLHGAAYDNLEPAHRYSTRSSLRKSSRDLNSTPEAASTVRTGRSFGTPGSSRRTSQISQPDLAHLGSYSPRTSPKQRASRRVQVVSPSSPNFTSSTTKIQAPSNPHRNLFASSTTTMTEGMLPTPVKTPKKKQIPKVNGAARALFQDQPVIGDEVMGSRRSRKGKRFNGFSLESFSADADEEQGGIQIFTDSRDKVPQADNNSSNPFTEHTRRGEPSTSKKLAGTSKRRKVSGEKKQDPQVADAIKKDEGMVYVFRGKKVYRKFDDADEEEEVIDTEDLGFLDRTPNGTTAVKPLKTLTRRSIQPTRLFQTDEQKRARELEKEEEAATDIEHDGISESLDVLASSPTISESKQKQRSRRSSARKPTTTASNSPEFAADKAKTDKAKKGSPFDTWKRLKAGPSSSAIAAAPLKSKKRGVSDAFEDDGK